MILPIGSVSFPMNFSQPVMFFQAVVTADFKASELAVKSEYPEYWSGNPCGRPSGDVKDRETHRKTMGKWWLNGILMGCYPLVMTNIQ